MLPWPSAACAWPGAGGRVVEVQPDAGLDEVADDEADGSATVDMVRK